MTEIVSCVVHWIFAMKYWSLSVKLELIQQRIDPDTNNVLFFRIYVVGIIANVLAGIGIGLTVILPTNKIVLLYSDIALIPMIASCVFLSNAYYRFL